MLVYSCLVCLSVASSWLLLAITYIDTACSITSDGHVLSFVKEAGSLLCHVCGQSLATACRMGKLGKFAKSSMIWPTKTIQLVFTINNLLADLA